ncbi:tail fiber protein [Chitinibacter bivalviorum]|uniref:Tail fiber protein n=1 Tax=Chitinibacter bivalviorum TaxID=2739434 RepID=A0A7H9BG73_9NEIS|nr:tail fiber protein [Chitinibacter bivalviorum]QLG87597.1 tail fiber protein [Chitinibacter bivalviorum]
MARATRRRNTPVIGSINTYTGKRKVAGEILHFAGSTPPVGTLACNGQLVSRTTYSNLFAAIGVTYGAGDGSTTFAVPDLRGEFIRSLDGGRGIDAGRALGSAQAATEISNYVHSDGGTPGALAAESVPITNSDGVGANIATPNGNYYFSAANSTNGGSAFSTASKIRPRNIAMLACIYY